MHTHTQAELGEGYELFQLEDRDERPTVVVLPTGRGMDVGISSALGSVTEVGEAVI
jgi:hypothetical protein